MMRTKKTVYTLNVNGYSPEITALTYPLISHYARKCGAEFYIINERKFSNWPVTYEKLQIYYLSKLRDDDWSIYIDSDALVHPETIDWTNYLPFDTVAHNGADMAAIRWKYTDYMKRDKRNIGSCNWNTIASRWCRDLWHPLDITPEEAIGHCFPTVNETNTIITPDHLVDDFALSNNIARFGLKFTTLMKLQEDIGLKDASFYWHLYTISVEEKVKQMEDIINQWNLKKYFQMASITYNNNNTWVAPNPLGNNNTIKVECWGGGGGGGSNNKTTTADGGAGGGGGAYARNNNVVVTPGASYTIIAGNGGGVGTSNNSNGNNGELSSFNNGTVLAQPGLGGNRNGVGPTALGTRGAGGNASNSVGEVTYQGGNGAADPGTSGTGGGGGGAGLNTGAGNPGSGITGGSGSGTSGNGGNGGAAGANGNAGLYAGGGGGGSGNGTGSTKRGGIGLNGAVTITWTEPDLTVAMIYF